MKIEQFYIEKLLDPLNDNVVLSLIEYLKKLKDSGVVLEDSRGKIDPVFEMHLRYISSKGMVGNINGDSDLKALGFHIGHSGSFGIVGDVSIMKIERENLSMVQNFNVGSITSKNVQVGNGNFQISNVNIQELVEKIAASDDKEAKGLLKSLLENSTVGSLIGVGVSVLIGLI